MSASSFEQILRKSPAFYKMGLSATVTRKDGQQPIVFMNLGIIRYFVDPKKQARNQSFTHRVLVKNTDFQLNGSLSSSSPIQDIFRSLWLDHDRNEMIVNDIKQAHLDGREILVLSERIEHLDLLYDCLCSDVENLFLLKGGMGKRQVKKIIDEISSLSEGMHRVILSTGKYLGEGIDFPCLDTLFLVFPVSWKGTLTQYAGRLNREYYGKTEIQIFDYVDQKVPVLSRMFFKRQKGYSALGFTIEDR